MKGKFGPYVKYKTINATIPDSFDPETIDLDEAIELIDKKMDKKPKKKKKKTIKKSTSKKK
jgi:DNA topoisomerase-1